MQFFLSEYTGISRQTNAGAPVIGATVIAWTVSAALIGSSREKPMIGFPWYLTAGLG